MDMLTPVVEVLGGFAFHNQPCHVCHERKAVLDLNIGIFEPCWHCKALGWELTRKKKHWWRIS